MQVTFINSIVDKIKCRDTRELLEDVGPWFRGERLLETHNLIGKEVQLPSSDWTTAAKLHLLSNQNISL